MYPLFALYGVGFTAMSAAITLLNVHAWATARGEAESTRAHSLPIIAPRPSR